MTDNNTDSNIQPITQTPLAADAAAMPVTPAPVVSVDAAHATDNSAVPLLHPDRESLRAALDKVILELGIVESKLKEDMASLASHKVTTDAKFASIFRSLDTKAKGFFARLFGH